MTFNPSWTGSGVQTTFLAARAAKKPTDQSSQYTGWLADYYNGTKAPEQQLGQAAMDLLNPGEKKLAVGEWGYEAQAENEAAKAGMADRESRQQRPFMAWGGAGSRQFYGAAGRELGFQPF